MGVTGIANSLMVARYEKDNKLSGSSCFKGISFMRVLPALDYHLFVAYLRLQFWLPK